MRDSIPWPACLGKEESPCTMYGCSYSQAQGWWCFFTVMQDTAAAQGEATATLAGPPPAACQIPQDLSCPLHTHKAPGFLQREEAPQHKFHQQNWSSLQLADRERSWRGGFPFQVHTWPITCEGRMAIDVTLEQFYKLSLLSISFSRQREMGSLESSSFFMTHFYVIIPIRSCLSRVFSSSD